MSKNGSDDTFPDSKETVDERKENEGRYRQFGANPHAAFWLNDWTSRKITYVSPAYETIWGGDVDSLNERPTEWLEVIHPDDRARVDGLCADSAANGGFDTEYRIIRRDGMTRRIHHRAFAIYRERGGMHSVANLAEDISGRTDTEDALRADSYFAEALTRTVNVIVLVLDTQSRIVRFNPFLERISGYTLAEVKGKDWFTIFIPPHDQERIRGVFSQATDGMAAKDNVNCIITKDGRERVVEWYSAVLKDAAGKTTGLLAAGADITESKRTEAALLQRTRELEERIKELNCLYEFAHLVEKTGISLEHILRGTVSLIPRSLQYPEIACVRLVFEGKEFKTELYKQTKWRLVSNINIKGKQVGTLEAYYMEEKPESDRGPFLNEEKDLLDAIVERLGRIIERHRGEERQRLLTQVVEQAAESILIMTTAAKIEYVNPAFERTTGYTREDVLGRHPRFLRDVEPELYKNLWKTIRKGEIWEGRLVSKKKDGTRYEEEGTVSPVRDEGGEIVRFVTVMRDITELVELRSTLLQTQKMEAIGQLAGGVAHDFNNILTVILTNAHYLLRAVEESSPLRQDIEDIKQSGERAASLTRQLLAFSRRQVVEPIALDLNQVLSGTENMLRRLIGENIELAAVLAPDLCLVHEDPSQVEQVIMNLAVNARDAMPAGGKLTFKTANVLMDIEHKCMFDDVTPGGWFVMLRASDTGCGMDETTRSRIFEPFFTTKELSGGTGLGLATIYGIVKQSGGHIWVDSELEKGTTFTIYFPRNDPEEQSHSVSESSNNSLYGSETILVVEDDISVLQIAARILREHQYAVLEAHNAKEALDICERKAGRIDLLITDFVLPGTSGSDLAALVSASYPGIKVVFMSGYAESGSAQLEASGAVFIQKPLAPREFARKVREVLDEN